MIRNAQREDCGRLYQLYLEGTNSGHAHEPARYSLEDFEAAVEDPRTVLLVALDERGLAGFALAYDLTSWVYLDILCVAPECRRQGLGTALLRRLSELSDCVEACFYSEDEELRRFAARQGWAINAKPTSWVRL